MQRGSSPRPRRRRDSRIGIPRSGGHRGVAVAGILLVLAAAPLPAQSDGWVDEPVRGAVADGEHAAGGFTPRPVDGDAAHPNGSTSGTVSGNRADPNAPGLRRAGERSLRNRVGEGSGGSTGGRLFRTLLWLVVVIGLAIGTLHLVRRFLPGSVVPQNRNLVRVVARTAIGPKQQVVVTQVAGQLLVLGVTGESITRIGEITDPDEVARAVPPEETFAGRFAAIEEVYGDEDEETPAWVSAADEKVESRLEPYRREISRLKSMVETWQRDDRHGERGTA